MKNEKTIMSKERPTTKIVVIGGSGLIGAKVVKNLRQQGHKVVAASPSSGVNTITGQGLAAAVAGAQVVVDVANAPSWEDKAVLEFFETSGRNLLAAEAVAGVGHHIALSVVGTDRLLASGYFRAKMAQEKLIKASPVPYTIVRATQFFEFVESIAQTATDGQTVRVPPALMQPIVSNDVAAALAEIAVEQPLNGTIELAGPEPIRMDELVRRFLSANRDTRKVITDAHAGYYGIQVNDQSLTPGDNPRIGLNDNSGDIVVQARPGFVMSDRLDRDAVLEPASALGASGYNASLAEMAGIFIAGGAGIAGGGHAGTASVLDVAPTIAALLHFTSPVFLEGRAIEGALK